MLNFLVRPKAIEEMESEDNEHTHYTLVSWFGLAYIVIYILHITSLFSFFPTSVKLTTAGFVFCMGPGLALYAVLAFFRKSNFPLLTLLVLSCSLGLTYNFLSNIFIFLFEPSLAQAMEGYLFVVALVYVFLLMKWKSLGITLFSIPGSFGQQTLIFSGLSFFAIAGVLFHQMPSGLYVEELIVLRKLFDNSVISATNIAFHDGEYTTYFFVPFYLFLAMSAKLSGIDILDIEGGMWPFTASISLLCFAAIMRHLSGNWVTVCVLMAMGLVHILFLNHPVSAELTVFAAFPDRYGLAAGVLIPLALFHFLIHVEHSRINIPAFVGLVYLIVEMTFIHARETLFFLGIVAMYAFIQAFDFKNNKDTLIRIFYLFCIVSGILLFYRYINLSIQGTLNAYISQMQNEMWAQFSQGLNEHGWLSLIGVPQFLVHGNGVWDSFQYANHFKQWERFPGFAFVPVTVCLLPVYVLAVDRPSLLLAPAAMAGFGLFSLFQGFHLLIGYIVGAPYIFDIFSVLFILGAFVFSDMARILGSLILLPSQSRFKRGREWTLILLVFLLSFVFFLNPDIGYATGVLEFEILVYLLTLIGVWVRANHFRMSNSSANDRARSAFEIENIKRWGWVKEAYSLPGRVAITAQCLAPTSRLLMISIVIGLFITGITFNSTLYALRLNDEQKWNLQEGKDVIIGKAFNKLSRLNLFYLSRQHDWRLPPSMVAYIRNNIPELQTWFGGHTLPIMAISNQYAPVLSVDGDVSFGFAANIFFLDNFYGVGTAKERFSKTSFLRMDFTEFLESQKDIAKLFGVLRDNGVQWVITRPREEQLMEHFLETSPLVRSNLALAFEAEGFKIFRCVYSSGKNNIRTVKVS